MKKRFLLLPAFLLALMLHAQTNDALYSFVDRHKTDPAFTFAFISKDLLDVTLKTDVKDQEWKKAQNVIKDLGSLRILAADKIKNGVALYKEVYDLIPADEFSELLAVRDEQTSVRIWVKEENDIVTDLVLLVGAPEDFVLIQFSGNIDLSNIASLATMFNSAEAKDLIERSNKTNAGFSANPNPSRGDITLKYDAEDDAPVSLTVIDQNGRQVSDLQLSGQSQEQIHLNHLNAGLYWLQLKTRQGKVGVQQVQIIR
jgi:hypothetical protein